MNASFSSLVGAATLALALAAGAAPRGVEAFDAATWQALQSRVDKPVAVVFSATWCPNCPETIENLADEIRELRPDAKLVAVVMDVAPGQQDGKLLREAHYRRADRLFAFAGAGHALRFTVDPRWRGVTPYVVLLSPKAPPLMRAGAPTEAEIQAWAAAGR